MKRIAVLTSGGDAPGMNAAVRAVVRACAFYKLECFIIYKGYQGLIENIIDKANARRVNNIINKGGTILKSARSSEFRTSSGRKKAYSNLKKNKIESLVVIGGDGSFNGARIFQKEFNFPVIGIPGTIDNDISGTQYTIGYDTAINTVIQVIDKIRDTAISHNRLFFIEVMGRDAGHIALHSGIGAGAEEILIPEEDRGLKKLLNSLKKSEKTGKASSIVVVAEGDKTGKNVFELASYVEKNLPDYEVRVSVLGHMQRGGAPTCFDRVLASRMGVFAVESLIAGKFSVMVGIENNQLKLTQLKHVTKIKSATNEDLLRLTDILSI